MLTWIGVQMQHRDNGDIPEWDDAKRRWYVRRVDRYFGEFNVAIEAAITGTQSPAYCPIAKRFSRDKAARSGKAGTSL